MACAVVINDDDDGDGGVNDDNGVDDDDDDDDDMMISVTRIEICTKSTNYVLSFAEREMLYNNDWFTYLYMNLFYSSFAKETVSTNKWFTKHHCVAIQQNHTTVSNWPQAKINIATTW